MSDLQDLKDLAGELGFTEEHTLELALEFILETDNLYEFRGWLRNSNTKPSTQEGED